MSWRAGALLMVVVAWQPGCSTTRAIVHSTLLPVSVAVDPAFRYVGHQRFVLRERADVEQHLFVDATGSGDVDRFVWIQFERLLPGVEGSYEYRPERLVTAGRLQFIASVRQYSTPPDAGSDRARAYALVESRGFRMPAIATRARLIYVPAEDRRSELMIVYAERAADVRELTSDETDELIRRAVASVATR